MSCNTHSSGCWLSISYAHLLTFPSLSLSSLSMSSVTTESLESGMLFTSLVSSSRPMKPFLRWSTSLKHLRRWSRSVLKERLFPLVAASAISGSSLVAKLQTYSLALVCSSARADTPPLWEKLEQTHPLQVHVRCAMSAKQFRDGRGERRFVGCVCPYAVPHLVR